jgi:hypothetical protein
MICFCLASFDFCSRPTPPPFLGLGFRAWTPSQNLSCIQVKFRKCTCNSGIGFYGVSAFPGHVSRDQTLNLENLYRLHVRTVDHGE